MLKFVMDLAKALGTILLMVVCGVGCGIAAFLTAAVFLGILGLSLHNNYEYYGRFPGTLLLYGSGAIGFLAPVVYLGPSFIGNLLEQKRPWQFSLRALLIATTAVAVVLGLIAAIIRYHS